MQPFVDEYRPGALPTAGLRDSLGLSGRGTKLHECIRSCLPFSFLEQLSRKAGFEMRVLSKAARMSRSTLARRAKCGRLTYAESDRLYSIASIFDAVIELFERDVFAV